MSGTRQVKHTQSHVKEHWTKRQGRVFYFIFKTASLCVLILLPLRHIFVMIITSSYYQVKCRFFSFSLKSRKANVVVSGACWPDKAKQYR